MFVDRDFEPYPDQWAFLSGVRQMRPEEVDGIAAAATRAGSVIGVRPSYAGTELDEDPWTLPPSGKRPDARLPGPFPPRVRITAANLVYVAKEGLPPALLSRLWRLAAFQNPEFYHAQAMRLSTFGKPRVISCAEDFDRHIGLPRGCLDDVRELLAAQGISIELVDERQRGTALATAFQGQLTPAQDEAAQAVLAHDIGVLCAPTAFGKTVVAAWVIAARQVDTLVLVHRKHLLDQWRERLATFLALAPGSIGQIGSGRKRAGGRIDVTLIQSLCRGGTVADVVAEYSQVIVDECHHIPAFTFERVLKAAKARFVLGLTATPIRKDGHHPIVIMQCGPLRFRVSPKDEAAARPFGQTVIPRPTDFQLPDGADASGIQGIHAALAASEQRNDLICADLLQLLRHGRTPLLLTERKEHLEEFARRLEGRVQHVVILHGGLGTKQRRAVAERLQAIPAEEPCAILATGRYAGEGFDYPRLDTLLLALPISWRGTLRQYAGRIQREHPGKREVRIYDSVDPGVPVLARMYEKRRKGYLHGIRDPARRESQGRLEFTDRVSPVPRAEEAKLFDAASGSPTIAASDTRPTATPNGACNPSYAAGKTMRRFPCAAWEVQTQASIPPGGGLGRPPFPPERAGPAAVRRPSAAAPPPAPPVEEPPSTGLVDTPRFPSPTLFIYTLECIHSASE